MREEEEREQKERERAREQAREWRRRGRGGRELECVELVQHVEGEGSR